jgi:Phosphoribosylanthranilate isomerase
MLIKICGMRDSANIQQVAALQPDWMGFIFYPKSKRYVGKEFVHPCVPGVKTVAVFVDEEPGSVRDIVNDNRFDFAQLHGDESPAYCKTIKDYGIHVIKAFGIYEGFNWQKLKPYQEVCDYFLFDTSTANYGGSGRKFDWQILENYRLSKPFLLSGGIGPDDAAEIQTIKHPVLAGIDLNSKFETAPALKDIEKLRIFLTELR